MKGSCSKWVTVPLGRMWQILNILVSLADLRANPSFPSSAVPALIFWWFIPHYGARFFFFFPFLLPKANRCSLDLPHLSGVTAEPSWRFSTQELLPWAWCTWAQHSQCRAGQLLQQIHSIAWAELTAQSPGLLYHIMEMPLLLPQDGFCCGTVIKSRYSSKIL